MSVNDEDVRRFLTTWSAMLQRAIADEKWIDPRDCSTAFAYLHDLLAERGTDTVEMEARKDAAYLERNRVVALLARCFPSGIARTAIEGWSEDWHGCVYIDLPTGQASWHFHDSHAFLFAGLPPYTKPWDGHDIEEKYRRVDACRRTVGAYRTLVKRIEALADEAIARSEELQANIGPSEGKELLRFFGRLRALLVEPQGERGTRD